MEKISLLKHEMYGTRTLFKAEGKLEQLLICLEETEGFAPTYFGVGDQSKFPYERQAAIEFCYRTPEPVIWGKSKHVRYELDIYINEGYDTKFDLDALRVSKKEIPALFFELGERLVQICQPVQFSSKFIVEEPEDDRRKLLGRWMNSGSTAGYNQLCGFAGVGGMVSYIPQDIARQFGMDYLKAGPALVEELPNGLAKIALCEKPWEETWDHLLDRWVDLMTYLAQTGLVAAPHIWDGRIKFLMSQKGFEYKTKMRAKYTAENKPIPRYFEKLEIPDIREYEKIAQKPYLMEIPGMKESEHFVLEQMKNEKWI